MFFRLKISSSPFTLECPSGWQPPLVLESVKRKWEEFQALPSFASALGDCSSPINYWCPFELTFRFRRCKYWWPWHRLPPPGCALCSANWKQVGPGSTARYWTCHNSRGNLPQSCFCPWYKENVTGKGISRVHPLISLATLSVLNSCESSP